MVVLRTLFSGKIRGQEGSKSLSVSVIFLGFLVGLSAAGVEITKLAIVAGGLGVGIGFGLQNVVNNFVSGLILLFERPIDMGDRLW